MIKDLKLGTGDSDICVKYTGASNLTEKVPMSWGDQTSCRGSPSGSVKLNTKQGKKFWN